MLILENKEENLLSEYTYLREIRTSHRIGKKNVRSTTFKGLNWWWGRW